MAYTSIRVMFKSFNCESGSMKALRVVIAYRKKICSNITFKILVKKNKFIRPILRFKLIFGFVFYSRIKLRKITLLI